MTIDDAAALILMLLAAWCAWHLLLLDTPRSRRTTRATAPGTHKEGCRK